MDIILEVTSSNYNSIKNFYEILLNKLNRIETLKFSILTTINKIKTKKKFTVLKSPHVNKDSREQFETVYYKKTIKIHSYQYLLLLFIIKRIKIYLCSDVRLKIYFQYNLKQFQKRLKSNLNLNNLIINTSTTMTINNVSIKNIKFVKNYLKYLDIFGESIIKTK